MNELYAHMLSKTFWIGYIVNGISIECVTECMINCYAQVRWNIINYMYIVRVMIYSHVSFSMIIFGNWNLLYNTVVFLSAVQNFIGCHICWEFGVIFLLFPSIIFEINSSPSLTRIATILQISILLLRFVITCDDVKFAKCYLNCI